MQLSREVVNRPEQLHLFLKDVITELTQLNAAVAEMATDHGTNRTTLTELKTLTDELHDDHATLKTLVDEIKTDYNATLAKLDADSGVGDTNYAATNAVSASSPATLTAPKATAPAAALSATVAALAVSQI